MRHITAKWRAAFHGVYLYFHLKTRRMRNTALLVELDRLDGIVELLGGTRKGMFNASLWSNRCGWNIPHSGKRLDDDRSADKLWLGRKEKKISEHNFCFQNCISSRATNWSFVLPKFSTWARHGVVDHEAKAWTRTCHSRYLSLIKGYVHYHQNKLCSQLSYSYSSSNATESLFSSQLCF